MSTGEEVKQVSFQFYAVDYLALLIDLPTGV